MIDIHMCVQRYIFLLMVALLAVSCSVTKHVPTDQKVYMGTNLHFTDKGNAESVELFDLTIQKIPRKGTRTGLGNIYSGIYNIFNQTGDSGFKHWVKYSLGKEPVIFEPKYIRNTEARLQYYLTGKGFFGADIGCDTITERRKVKIDCNVTLGQRYTIDSIIFPIDSTYAALKLDSELQRVIIKEGKYYDRDRLNFERIRLAKLAGDIGFANFGSENIYYYVDTLVGDHGVHVYAEVITPTDSTFHTRYTLDSIIVYPNHAIDIDTDGELTKVSIKEKMDIYEFDHYLNHKLIDRMIIQEPGKYYNRTNEQRSINRLLDLGIFKFINVNNRPSGSGKEGRIIQEISLTPEKMQNISGEVEVNNRSGNFLGTGVSLKYQHKNLFSHAERLDLLLSGQVETQFGSGLSLINSSDVTASAELAFPRFIVPFFNVRESQNYVPRTIINTTATRQRRTDFYTLQSLTAKYGYKWRYNSKVLHELYPLVINQVSVSSISDSFQERLDKDVRLSRSFEDVFIGGLQYYLSYSDQADNTDASYQYFRGEIETSGNVLGLFYKGSVDQPAEFAGERFAQFVKLTLDYRRYFPIAGGDIATRMIVGSGFTYGNNSELPYIKQYVVGGSNSLRAFRLRGLGPGSSVPDEPTDPLAAQFIDQTGDVKIEMNVEYRFPIFSYLKGALFVDAGNVWLVDSEELPAGNFQFQDFWKELGVGAGLGFRLDFNFFLIRMDIAFPIRSPQQDATFAWQFTDVNPLSADWRSDNLRYNLGIGYPF